MRSIYSAAILLIVLLTLTSTVRAQQISEIITDFSGYWKTTTAANNPVLPNNSHNLLCFKYNTVNYSTGVDDNKLTANSVTFTAGDYRAFPISTVGGTVSSGGSIYIALASQYDGVPNGYSSPYPYLRMKDVLIDGVNGLNLGTGATNIPASALVNFPISTVITSSIADSKPDIVVSQIAQPTSTGDTLYFVNSSGVVVGSKVSINWNVISRLGTYYLDLYTLPTGSLCDTAHISGTFSRETTRDIRLLAFKLSDFGITAGNASNVTGFILKASGTSDPAFIAYNTDAFVIPAPVITVHPVTQVVCPNVSNSVTFSVTATGGSLSYQWRKNNTDIPGATGNTYTIANVTSASAGAYTVLVSNPVGSVVSNPAYLNAAISVQPSPSAQVIATGASCTLSITATNATSYQWKAGGVDIPGATSSTFTINPVTGTNTTSYSVQVINAASGGCASVTSNAVTVTGAKVLYSKSSGNLSQTSTWGVNTDGSGSAPADFSRSEHTFIVQNNASTGGDLAIAGKLDLKNAVVTITAGTTLDAGRITRSGTGTISGTTSSSLTVRDTSSLYFSSGSQVLKNLTITSGDIHLYTPLSISGGTTPGTVTLSGGKFNSNDNLTLSSDANGTARIAPITGGATINGKVTIERYLPANKGWRLLGVPINATNAPTINAAWQEGVTTASPVTNPNPGYGIQIAGGTTANGFDQSPTTSTFIKTFDNASNSFVRLAASPGTYIPITSYPAYCVYVRGDRSINLMQGLNAAITSTTLRMKGELNTGNQVVNVNPSNLTLVSNPYASAIDFSSLTRSNVKNSFYIWDPLLAGAYGLGAYVTVSYNSVTGLYDRTSSVSPVGQYIQSGEAFLVQSNDNTNPGTLTFKETDKSSSINVSRNMASDSRLTMELYLVNNADSSKSLLDGTLITYDSSYQNIIDQQDALKLAGSNENLGIKSNNKLLAIERRAGIAAKDTLQLNLAQMRLNTYQLKIHTQNMSGFNRVAFVKDNFLNTQTNIPLDVNGTAIIPFTVTTAPGSYAAGRFQIVFETLATLPVKFVAVQAIKQQDDVVIKWQVEEEQELSGYIVERSSDGRNFTAISGIIKANGSQFYNWTDHKVQEGEYYYRVKSVNIDGKTANSSIVKVSMTSILNQGITVYPNPVKGKVASILMHGIPKGNYTINVLSVSGQLIKKISFNYNSNTVSFLLDLENLLPGNYLIQMKNEQVTYTTRLLKTE
ncbi:MAG: T9SS type A sorting domain-containing protein [Ferruginibacter sp.]